MSKMETTFRKGKKQRKIVLLSLLLAAALAVSGVVTAMAAYGWQGRFYISVYGEHPVDAGSYWGGDEMVQDASMQLSTTERANFRADKIFYCYGDEYMTSSWGWGSSNSPVKELRAFEVYSTDITSLTAVQMSIELSEKDKKNWTEYQDKDYTRFTYRNSSSITYSSFNDLMSKITVYFDSTKGEKSGQAKVSIRAWADRDKMPSSLSSSDSNYIITDPFSSYSCQFDFYSYAEGRADPDSAVVDYKAEAAADHDQTYEEYAPEQTDNAEAVNPQDLGGGKVQFDMFISDTGSGGRRAQVGYQVKTSSSPWTSTILPVWDDGIYGIGTPNEDGEYDSYYNVMKDGKPVPGQIELSKWNNTGKAIPLTVTGLDAGVTYEIRGVVATDGKTDNYKYTDSFTVQYEKPNINSFNTGSSSKIYKGGTDSIDVSALSVFNDTNSVSKSYMGVDGNPYTGPALRATLYFTPNLQQTVENEDGEEVPGVDHSVWYQIHSDFKTLQEPSAGGTGDEEEPEVPVVSSTYSYNHLYTLPSNLQDLNPDLEDQAINSTSCAFKLVITDEYTGYSIYTYSDPFTIDSSAPSKPTVNVKDGNGQDLVVDLDQLQEGQKAAVVGGKNARVRLTIGGSGDFGGSGIKEYRYAMYYVPTEAVTASMGSTRREILETMRQYTPTGSGAATYTDWTPAEDAIEVDQDGNYVTNEDGSYVYIENTAQLNISKDGYYRIDAKAVDNAGYETPETDISSAYFQVDLSAPAKPEVHLVRQKDGVETVTDLSTDLEPYDNRTYTNSLVWLIAYSTPQVGKTLDYFEISTDGGLNWRTTSDAASVPENERIPAEMKVVDLTNETKTVTAYPDGQYDAGQEYLYQVAINLSGLGIDDYSSILVRASDTLTNESLTSDPVVMRTVGQAPRATSVLDHEGVEVALAKGKTSESGLSVKTIQRELKNRAAQKINEKYYGNGGSTTIGAEDFNPWKYLKENLKHTSGNTAGSINCDWGNTASTDGPCVDPGCPYAKMAAMGYELYTPEMVNVQGMSSSTSLDSVFPWVRYDHTMYYSVGGKVIPTVAYTQGGNSSTPYKTNLAADTEMATYKNGSTTRYTATKDRVVYLGQTSVTSSVSGLASQTATNTVSGSSTTGKSGGLYDEYMYNIDRGLSGGRAPSYAWVPGNEETLTAAGRFATGYSMYKHIYHLVDASVSNGTVTSAGVNISDSVKDQLTMKKIRGVGYVYGSFRDWLFCYNDKSDGKQIAFTINDADVVPHANDGFGFLFNTTIRQNKDGKWVISGYLFYEGNTQVVGSSNTTTGFSAFRWYIVKLIDVDLEQFADGTMRYGGRVPSTYSFNGNQDTDDFVFLFDHTVSSYGAIDSTGSNVNAASKAMQVGDGAAISRFDGTLEMMAKRSPDTYSASVRHFRIVIGDTGTTRVYMYNTGTSNSRTVEQLNDKFNEDVTDVNITGASSYTSGFRLLDWTLYKNYSYASNGNVSNYTTQGGVTTLDTPAPTVDGLQVGHMGSSTLHKDTNAYGFGPLVAARTEAHGCTMDSMVEFSNIFLQVDMSRKLTEVVTEPQWGGGKARFIANISDDSIDEFQDPVLTAQVQWRLFYDEAKFIGWGRYQNKSVTEQFLERVEGEGMYESATSSSGTQLTKEPQYDDVAEYITQQYFKAFGFDADSTETIDEQVKAKVEGHGSVYSLADMNKVQFSVTPEKYNTSTANPDFPQGRWYVVHDATGYTGVTGESKTGSYYDGLDLNIVEPGRYTVYFAPDEEKRKNGSLNPADAVFDFVVNQPPEARFSGYIEDNVIMIDDAAYDPDTGYRNDDGSIPAPNGQDYTYVINGETKTYNDVQLTGIAQKDGTFQEEWRWDILSNYTDSSGNAHLITVAADGWSTKNPQGKTLSDLTLDCVTADARTYCAAQVGSTEVAGKTAYYLTDLPSNAVLTVYQRAKDTSTYQVAETDASGNVTSYSYVPTTGVYGNTTQQNLTGSNRMTYAPLSAFSVSSVEIYNTAVDGTDTGRITLTRQSKHTQKRTDYTVSWSIDIGDGRAEKTRDQSPYYSLVRDTGTGDYYLYPESYYPTKEYPNRTVPAEAARSSMPSGVKKVLTQVTAPSVDSQGNGSGQWEIAKSYFEQNVQVGGKIVVQMMESIVGYDSPLATQETTITDASARAVFYKADTTAPSGQTVKAEVQTWTEKLDEFGNPVLDEDGEPVYEWADSEYKASDYLDVTGGHQQIVLHVSGAKDGQGAVGGYVGYFFKKSAIAANTLGANSENLYETAIYYMDSTGKLVEVPIVYNGVTYNPAQEELVAGSAWNRLTAEQRAQAILAAKKTAVQNSVKLGPDGGDVIIGENAMNIADASGQSSSTINLAFFAYDTATGIDSLTGHNESQKTRMEGIKLTKSQPMPPEIAVTNTLNLDVARIGNEAGYNDYTAIDLNGDGKPDETDPQTTALQNAANTNVTVQFTPRKAKFKLNSVTGEYERNESGTDYNEDIYHQADLTGVANVKYTIQHRRDESESYKIYSLGGVAQKDVVIPSARTLTLSEEGNYIITAQIVNGAGTASEERVVSFVIDKTPPTEITMRLTYPEGTYYTGSSWARTVVLTMADSTDVNMAGAKYMYTLDDGKTWHDGGMLTSTSTITIGRNESDTGEYTLRVKAVDIAGNEQTLAFANGERTATSRAYTVRIDRQAPVVPGPSLKASSTTVPVYTDYTVSLSYESTTGTVHTLLGGALNKTDTEIFVASGETARFYFYPAEGRTLGTVRYAGRLVTPEYDDEMQAYYVEVSDVTADAVLAVTFPEEGVQGTSIRPASAAVFATRSVAQTTLSVLRQSAAPSLQAENTSGETGTEGSGTESGGTGEADPEPTPEPDPTPDPSPSPSPDPEPDPEPDPDPVTTYQVMVYSTPNGVVNPMMAEVAENDPFTLTIQPDSDYQISLFTINGVSIPLEALNKMDDGTYSYFIDHIVQDTEIEVEFAPQVRRTLHLSYSDCGTAEVVMNSDIQSSGKGEYSVLVGSTVTIQMLPASDQYMVKSLTVDGKVLPVDTTTNTRDLEIPAYEGENDPGITVEVEFGIATGVETVNYSVETVGYRTDDGLPHGTVTPSGINEAGEDVGVEVPVEGAREFLIVPDSGYKIRSVAVTQLSSDGAVTSDCTDQLKEITSDSRSRKFLLEKPNGPGRIVVTFERQTYSVIIENAPGGNVSVTDGDGNYLNLNRVPEGTPLIVTARPNTGYKLTDLRIFYGTVNGSVGAVTSWKMEGIYGRLTVSPVFAAKTVDHMQTAHMITAVANNVKDVHDALAAEPYSFRISDGVHTSAWSEWSASNTISYTSIVPEDGSAEIPLSPNRLYTISVRARDRVGNWSTASSSQVYTCPNIPIATGAEAVDTPGDSNSKSVALSIDSNGNPSDTEYLVYYSTSANMRPIYEANGGAWTTLDNGRILINGLTPGIPYYLQVVARNHKTPDPDISELNNDNIIRILLSPASPPSNSLYFEEQDGPLGAVTLHWDPPAGSVNQVEIYRDGMRIGVVDAEMLSFTDNSDGSSLAGDSIAVYSYAYVNTAGVGSSQTAVSKEYYDAFHVETDETTGEVKDPALLEKLNKMDALKLGVSYDLFSESMTYPRFPLGLGQKPIASSKDTQYSGQISVRMMCDTTGTVMGRHQKYFLTLKAYDPVVSDSGETTYNLVEDWKLWDPAGKYHNTSTGEQTPVETVTIDANGPRASWSGLNTQYEYRVFVERVQSVGPRSRNDGYTGQNSAGVEYTLGKTYYVDRNGYGYYYNSPEAKNVPLDEQSYQWSADRLATYTNNLGWDQPINVNQVSYIKFNKSPYVELAGSNSVYAGNDPEKIREDASGKYILLDQSVADEKFTIKVAAWDLDGTDEDDSYVSAVIGGTEIKGNTGSLKGVKPLKDNRDAAMQDANLYTIEFDVSGLATGVYDSVTLKASDGITETEETGSIRLVVNNTLPSVSTNKSGIRKVEQGENYSKDSAGITSAVAAGQTGINEARLLIMPEQYQKLFGATTMAGLRSQLNVVGGSALNEAKKLLGDDVDQYLDSNGRLTEDGLQEVLTRVAPPVTAYLRITEAQYNQLVSNAAAKDKLRKETNPLASYYWVEQSYALSNPGLGLCTWLSDNGDGTVKITGEPGEYYAELVAHFGRNESAQVVTVRVSPPPSVSILSDQYFGWVEASNAEYNAYGSITVADAIAQFEGCYSVEPDLSDGTQLTDSAAKEENGVKKIFTLVDRKARVSDTWLSGTLNVELGVYEALDEVGVYFSTDPNFDPNTGNFSGTELRVSATKQDDEQTSYDRSGDYSFAVEGLMKGQHYYLWAYYKVTDPETGETRESFNDTRVVLTTLDNSVTYYGFETRNHRYFEKDYADQSGDLVFTATGMGSKETSAKLTFTLNYYQADEFGTIKYDDAGAPLPITGEQLEAAKETLHFANGEESMDVTVQEREAVKIPMILSDTLKEQGHMVVRLNVSVTERITGYTRLNDGKEYTDIFVQDDESEVQSFRIGLYNDDGNGNPIVQEIKDTAGDYYFYQLAGLQVGYFNTAETLTLNYMNIGTGDLENIRAKVCADPNGKTPSTAFHIAREPTETSITANLTGRMGQVSVSCMPGLEDGEYFGYLILYADHMEEKDYVVVKLRQIVGQSTLHGRIYITPNEPALTQWSGISTVYLYDGNETTTNLEERNLLYKTETDRYGNYTIPNIINGKNYHIVIKRDGFVTYSTVGSIMRGCPLVTDTTSKSYTFDIRLLGGDIDGDQNITETDLNILISHFNEAYDLTQPAAEDGDETDRELQRCDFNEDGAVNFLDRAFVFGNVGSDIYSYFNYNGFKVLTPDT